MKLHPILLFLCWIFPLHFFGQSTILGKVYDEKSKQPVEYASVYIDGSTNGCMSDATGNFRLNKVQFPCALVVSHLSYTTQSIYLKDNIVSPLNILMSAREIKIQEINVTDKNLREGNMNSFRTQFLGTDIWGRYATIENEEGIRFSKDYRSVQSKIHNKILPSFIQNEGIEIEWSEDSSLVSYKRPINLKVSSPQSLKVNLPLLGYTYYYDLVEFVWQYQSDFNSDICFSLGYIYFKEQPLASKRDSIRIRDNRIKCYYNSAQHFRKSLYEKRLAQNGYKVYGMIRDELTGKEKLKEVDLVSCIEIEGNTARIIGLEGIKLNILYYKNFKGLPVDLTLRKGISPTRSEVIFTSDTCMIRDNGTVPDNSIVFGPEIGLKKFGAILPDNFLPSE